jgi:hypothetical protein
MLGYNEFGGYMFKSMPVTVTNTVFLVVMPRSFEAA